MFEEFKNELKIGKKVYLFELISLIGFLIFITLAGGISEIIGILMTNVMLMAWLGVNVVVITVYGIFAYVKVIIKEYPVGENIGRTLLFKILIFIFWFGISAFMFLSTTGMSIPLLALVLTLLVVAYAKNMMPSKKLLIVLGIMWFVVFFLSVYIAYPFVFAAIYALIKHNTIASILVNFIYFGTAILLFVKLIKKTQELLIQ